MNPTSVALCLCLAASALSQVLPDDWETPPIKRFRRDADPGPVLLEAFKTAAEKVKNMLQPGADTTSKIANLPEADQTPPIKRFRRDADPGPVLLEAFKTAAEKVRDRLQPGADTTSKLANLPEADQTSPIKRLRRDADPGPLLLDAFKTVAERVRDRLQPGADTTSKLANLPEADQTSVPTITTRSSIIKTMISKKVEKLAGMFGVSTKAPVPMTSRRQSTGILGGITNPSLTSATGGSESVVSGPTTEISTSSKIPGAPTSENIEGSSLSTLAVTPTTEKKEGVPPLEKNEGSSPSTLAVTPTSDKNEGVPPLENNEGSSTPEQKASPSTPEGEEEDVPS